MDITKKMITMNSNIVSVDIELLPSLNSARLPDDLF